MLEEKEIKKIELELLITAFKNRSIFMIFLMHPNAYEAILSSVDQKNINDKKTKDFIQTFHRKLNRIMLMPIPDDLENIHEIMLRDNPAKEYLNIEKLREMHEDEVTINDNEEYSVVNDNIRIRKNILMRSIYVQNPLIREYIMKISLLIQEISISSFVSNLKQFAKFIDCTSQFSIQILEDSLEKVDLKRNTLSIVNFKKGITWRHA